MTNKPVIVPTNCDFSEIYGGPGKNDCTPRLNDSFSNDFEGILINGPTSVVWPKGVPLQLPYPGSLQISLGPLRLMIAGLCCLKGSDVTTYGSLNGRASDEVLIVVVDQASAAAYCGKMPSMNYMEPPPAANPVLDLNGNELCEYSRQTTQECAFNVDLVCNAGVPIADARYTVFATLGSFTSNVLEIETRVA